MKVHPVESICEALLLLLRVLIRVSGQRRQKFNIDGSNSHAGKHPHRFTMARPCFTNIGPK